jgi:Flp pilus assembly protein TadG
VTFIRRRRSEQQGQTAVEFALVLPILAVLLIGIVEFGVAFHDYVTVTDASRVAARKAAVARHGGAPYDEAAEAAGKTAGESLDWTKPGADVVCDSEDWTTPGSDVSCTVTYPYSINLVGFVVTSGVLTNKTTERLE